MHTHKYIYSILKGHVYTNNFHSMFKHFPNFPEGIVPVGRAGTKR